MTIHEAVHILSGLIDNLYMENDGAVENYEEIEKAESLLAIVARKLELAGIETLSDVKEKIKQGGMTYQVMD